MNKTELVAAVAEKADITKIAAAKAVESVMSAVTEALTKGDQVTLIGFGNFSVRDRKARSGRDPRTKEIIQIKASKVPVFKAGKSLKDSVNFVAVKAKADEKSKSAKVAPKTTKKK